MGRQCYITKESFMKRAKEAPNGCLEWSGAVTNGGYGRACFLGKRDLAHRASYRMHFGEIPEGKMVLHKCDNPKCVNPDHIYVGTRADNDRDRVLRGRASKGSNHPPSKLHERDIPKIRMLLKYLSQRAVAKLFAVSQSTICDVKSGLNWSHIKHTVSLG